MLQIFHMHWVYKYDCQSKEHYCINLIRNNGEWNPPGILEVDDIGQHHDDIILKLVWNVMFCNKKFFSHSQNGLTCQIYCVYIESQSIALRQGLQGFTLYF